MWAAVSAKPNKKKSGNGAEKSALPAARRRRAERFGTVKINEAEKTAQPGQSFAAASASTRPEMDIPPLMV